MSLFEYSEHQFQNDRDIYSFDVFDTLLFRTIGPPESVFRLIEKKWSTFAPSIPLPADFSLVREGAEERVRKWLKTDSVTFQEIYDDVAFHLDLPAPTIKLMMELEMRCEREVLRPLPTGIKLLTAARRTSRRIMFLSDMYLPGAFLQDVLQASGIFSEGDRLFVSGDRRVSKACGTLYKAVAKELGDSSNRFHHFGDSSYADVAKARQAGWQADHVTVGCLSTRESKLFCLDKERAGWGGVWSGAARCARIAADFSASSTSAEGSIGSSVAGPLLYAYARWILDRAVSRGIGELFFLARDGQAIMEMCQVINSKLGNAGPKLSYLFGSRQVWLAYALSSRSETEQATFFAERLASASDRFTDCLAILGLGENEACKARLSSQGPPLAEPLNRQSREAFYQWACVDDVIGPLLHEKLKSGTSIYMDYLRDFPVRADVNTGIVDIGWSGVWMDVVADMFEEISGKRPASFLLGRHKPENFTSRTDTSCFLFDKALERGLPETAVWLVPLVEIFCGADHGRVNGMRMENDKAVPVHSSTRFSGLSEESFTRFRQAMIYFANGIDPNEPWQTIPFGLRERLLEPLGDLWEFPSASDARFISSSNIALSPDQDNDRRILRPYRWKDLITLMCKGRLPGFAPHWWHHGALAVTSNPLRCLFWFTHVVIESAKQSIRTRRPPFRSMKPGDLRKFLKSLRWLKAANRA